MSHEFCFSTLALKPKYRLLAVELAASLETYAPGVILFVGTDDPHDFKDCKNVYPFKFKKRGVFCYHDKRFVLEKALQQFKTAIQIDADTRIIGPLPEVIEPTPGLAAVHIEKIIGHSEKYNPERLGYFYKLATKLQVDLDAVSYIGEALFALSNNGDKTLEFFRQWGFLADYFELNGIYGGEGNALGLAAAKAGLEILKPTWLQSVEQIRKHFDASIGSHSTAWDNFLNRVDYHYHLNKIRITSLRNIDFYYR
ncbi:MAG: hypothetical protein SFW36_22220 [Leptolyngbyaceae cyanobacterium bins.59]|nr:hypothetical protein [Leptolyngbyaceae cyanobacterium bins.59]